MILNFVLVFDIGGTIIPVNLDFLFRDGNSDFLILKHFKDVIQKQIQHALVLCCGIMHGGTTIDQFLRDNLEWMGKAALLAKFAATSSLGMIHPSLRCIDWNIVMLFAVFVLVVCSTRCVVCVFIGLLG